MLTHPPSHPLIREVFSYLQPELSFSDDVELLRGPLEPFAKAHAKALAESIPGAEKPGQNVDWRKRKKAFHEQANMAIGVYQIEEIVL